MQAQQSNYGDQGRAADGDHSKAEEGPMYSSITRQEVFPRKHRVKDLLWVGLVIITVAVGGLLLQGATRSAVGVAGLASLVFLSVAFARRDLLRLRAAASERKGYFKALDSSFRSHVHPFLPLLVAAITAIAFFGAGASNVSIALSVLFCVGYFGVGFVLQLLVHPADSVERRNIIDAAAVTSVVTLVLLFGAVPVMPVVVGQLSGTSEPNRVALTWVASYAPAGLIGLMGLSNAIALEVLRRKR